MDLQKNIRERCHVNKNDEGDSFVGVKADTDDAVIYFPIGYQLPPNDDDLRADINNLFYVLAAFMKEDRLIEESKFAAPRTVDFPMHAYLKIIRDFLRTGRYYIETDPQFKTACTRHSIKWDGYMSHKCRKSLVRILTIEKPYTSWKRSWHPLTTMWSKNCFRQWYLCSNT